jgi:FkbM family methyltransferase
MNFRGKEGQDRWAFEILGKPKYGFYLDIGAHNGIDNSNSYAFEQIGWNGICVEPNPLLRGFQTLKENRKCLCLNVGLYDKEGEVDFIARGRHPECSGIIDKYASSSVLEKYNKGHNVIKVPVITLNQLVERYNVPKIIDYMSLDTEGSEYSILKDFNFDKYIIRTLTVEHNYFAPSYEEKSLKKKKLIEELLTKNGYILIKTHVADDYYIHSSVEKDYVFSNVVKSNTIVPMKKLKAIAKISTDKFNQTSNLNIAEVGVYKGGIGVLFKNLFPSANIYLCDTFCGIPYHNEKYDNYHKKGDFSDTTLEHVKSLFSCDKVKCIQGIFPKSATPEMNDSLFDIVHLDVDVYQGYKECLEYFSTRMTNNGIILLDDYNCKTCKGATIAVDEFVKANDNFILDIINRQYFLTRKEEL